MWLNCLQSTQKLITSWLKETVKYVMVNIFFCEESFGELGFGLETRVEAPADRMNDREPYKNKKLRKQMPPLVTEKMRRLLKLEQVETTSEKYNCRVEMNMCFSNTFLPSLFIFDLHRHTCPQTLDH